MKINPNLKIGILSNGLNCNQKTFDDYGILDNLYLVQVSIHATKESTYNKIVRDSNFEKVKKNLVWLASQKNKGCIPKITMNFVVMSYNYKEIPDFAIWAKTLGVDCEFWELRQHPEDNPLMLQDDNFQKLAVFQPQHPEYKNLVKILKSPILKENFVVINSFLSDLK